MTTEKLIKLAEICGYDCSCSPDCPYYTDILDECGFKLLNDVTDRLNQAYIALKEQGDCNTCKYSDICSGDGDADTGCNGSDKWEWEGDNSD